MKNPRATLKANTGSPSRYGRLPYLPPIPATPQKFCTTTTLCAINPTRTDLVPKPGLRGDRRGTNHLGWGAKLIGCVWEKVLSRKKRTYKEEKRGYRNYTTRNFMTYSQQRPIQGQWNRRNKLHACRHQKHGIVIAADVKGPTTKPVRWWATILKCIIKGQNMHMWEWFNWLTTETKNRLLWTR